MGMTFEMASARGLLAYRDDGTQLTYADGVQRHFVASVATIETAGAERDRLLRDFVAFRAESDTDEGFVLPRRGDIGRVDKLAALLLQQGIEVHQLPDAARICGAVQPAGSYLISGEQPAGRLASTLLASDSPVSVAFWAEQERRVGKGLRAQIYDIIAWSLPSLWGVEVSSCRLRNLTAPPANEVPDTGYPMPAQASVAYLVPWGSQAAASFLSAALRRGLVVDSSSESFVQNGREFGAGVLILRTSANQQKLHQQVLELAGSTGAEVVATSTSWVESGVNFGSDKVRRVPKTKVAIVWGEPAAISSAGSLRYVLEQKLGYPAVPIRPANLESLYLDAFDVLVLPDGPKISISQGLGTQARGCRLDVGALEKAVGLARAEFDKGADLLIVNKFGKHEAEGRGFRELIADALAADIPVLVGLNALNQQAFDQFVGDMAKGLTPQLQAVLNWVEGCEAQ